MGVHRFGKTENPLLVPTSTLPPENQPEIEPTASLIDILWKMGYGNFKAGFEADVPLGIEVIEENNAPPSRMAGEEEEEQEQEQPQLSLEDRNEIGFDGEKSVATRNESAAPSKSSAMMETTVVAPLKSVGQAPSVDTPLLIPVESIESTDPAPVETVVNTPSQPALLTATPALTEKVATTPESREKPYEADIEEAGSVMTTAKATTTTTKATPSTASAQSIRDEKAEYLRQMLEMQRQLEMMREMMRKFNALQAQA